MLIKSSFGSKYKEYEIGNIVKLATDEPLVLDSALEIKNFNMAYQTYGKLNKDKSNAILICHALTGDQYIASKNPITGKDGWWNKMVGKGKAIDTDKYFVICSNTIGGCFGSFGPKDINPETGKIYGLDFPVLTIHDMVRAQKLLIDHFKIDQLLAVIGGSMGGMQALSWSFLYPHKMKAVVPIATSYRHSTQNIAFDEVGRQAIMADPNWCNGDYISQKKYPAKGLAVARMAGHITYLSEDALHKKFGRNLQDKDDISYHFDIDFQVESYLRHQGVTFVERFDANSYLYLTKAMDYFDLEAENNGILSNAFRNVKAKFCIFSFSDDWLFTPDESKKLAQALNISGANISLVNIESKHGHDSFLIDNENFKETLSGFINSLK
ncbi:MAG: homoserine O-acetyltransferase [Proteobacteria bacterium]|nr:homoserine O-acetyltransferase [Pseudomonadota bacterium]